MSAIRCVALAVLCALAGPALGQPATDPLGALAGSHDVQRQIQSIDEISHATPPSPQAPAALLAVVRDAGADWSVRGEALEALRRIDAPDETVQQAIAAAGTATGPHAGYLKSHAAALLSWRDARATRRGAPAQSPADAERRARQLLKSRNVDVSMDSLSEAIGEGQSGTVAVLLTAGLKIGGADAARATMATLNGMTTACSKDPVPFLGVGQCLDVLVKGGMPVDLADSAGNTLLMSAAQFCPGPVAARLLQLGARPAPVNKQNWTPLQMALVSGKWDVVAVLVGAGARITPAQSGQIFMQPPQEPSQRDLLAHATKTE